jgi:hypothetical protein
MHLTGKPTTFKQLEELDLDEEDTDLHGSLTSLDLRNNPIPASASHALSKALQSNVLITSLNGMQLEYRPWISFEHRRLDGIRPYELVWLSQRFHYLDILEEDSCMSLTALDLSGMKLTGGFPFEDYDGVAALSEALSMNRSITHLDVSENELFEKGAKMLAEGLTINTTLTSLNMANNDITIEGAQSFLDFVVNHNSVLYLLDLTLNNIRQKNKDVIKEIGLQNQVIIQVNEEKR